MPSKRPLSDADHADAPPTSQDTVYFSEGTIEDRASIFSAAFLPLSSLQSGAVKGITSSSAASKRLQGLPQFGDAMHKITAWRLRGAQKTISGVGLLDLGHDDDGEKWAGGKLEKLLDRERLEGAICVARWYGGVMLGPVRFNHIENVAKDAIAVWRDATEGAKRRKIEAEEEEQQRRELMTTLQERDSSVAVLRRMLADKSSNKAEAPASVKLPDYARMELDVLKKLERARDSTIAVLLKKIDEAEKPSSKPNSANDHRTDQGGGSDETTIKSND